MNEYYVEISCEEMYDEHGFLRTGYSVDKSESVLFNEEYEDIMADYFEAP